MSKPTISRQQKWDLRFLDLCKLISLWSKDPSTKVGAVITRGIEIVSLGYNGLPQQIIDDKQILENRWEKYKYIIHAEMNAILTAKRPLHNCTLYTFPFLPCTNCASMTIQSGISRVVSIECVDNRWEENLNNSKKLFNEANIDVTEYSVYT
jgi:dCMP deaminase